VNSATGAGASGTLSKLPAWFEPNQGQLPAGVCFQGRSQGYTLVLDCGGVTTMQLPYEDSADVVRLELEGGHARGIVGEGKLPSVTRIYRGSDPSELEIPHVGRVRSEDVYPGIDFVWLASGIAFRYEFHLKPMADATQIRLRFDGIRGLAVSPEGELVVHNAHGEIRYRRPVAFQSAGTGRIVVDASYQIDGPVATLRLGRYDQQRPLVIDPLVTSTYLGGSGYDAVNGLAVDTAGSVYLAGQTASTNFPVSGARSAMTRSAFVARLSADLSSIQWVTILGSSGNDCANGLTIDAAGNAYVVGAAGAANFPVSANALQSAVMAAPVAFVAKISSSGRLLYSTLLGSENTVAYAVALDAALNVYVAGSTSSVSFVTTSGAPQRSFTGGSDGFVAKLNLSAPALIFSTLVGGYGFDALNGVAVRTDATVCVAGSTTSSNVPVRNAVQPSLIGGQDALVGCLNPSGSAWNFLTYWGGGGADYANAISLDSTGALVIAGTTMSQNFPAAMPASARGDYDAFVTKLRADGSGAVFSTLLGGSGSDSATSVVVDPLGSIWVGGYTGSTNFPQQLAFQAGFGGSFDGFLANLNSAGSLLFSTYLGGSGDDRVQTVGLRTNGYVAAAGMTSSSNFPTTSGTIETKSAGPYDGFVTIVSNTTTKFAMPGTFLNGVWQMDMNGSRFWEGPAIDRQMSLGEAGDIPVTGDWNGDGPMKGGIFRAGLWVIDYNGNGIWDSGDRYFYLGQAGDIPVVADWNGDGRTKAGIFRAGLWVIDYNGNFIWDSGDHFFYLGQGGDVPIVGDWNGDGRTKAGVFRDGLWVIDYNGNFQWDSGDRFFYIGQAGDKPLLGDWNGDGRTKGGVFRDGLCVIDYNGTFQWDSGDRFFYVGQAGDIPVVGDWNGDGRAKVGTFRGGNWLFDLSGNGTAVSAVFGAPNGVPVVGKWQ